MPSLALSMDYNVQYPKHPGTLYIISYCLSDFHKINFRIKNGACAPSGKIACFSLILFYTRHTGAGRYPLCSEIGGTL